jgi:hypothetical protein
VTRGTAYDAEPTAPLAAGSVYQQDQPVFPGRENPHHAERGAARGRTPRLAEWGSAPVVPFWRPREDTGHNSSTGTIQVLVKVVAFMPEAVQTQSRSEAPAGPAPGRLTLNSDGQRHPVLNAATVFTFVAGMVAFACGLIVKAHAVGAILGIVVFGVGMITQMNSATREQRIFLMAGVIGAFVGLALGIAHGGFY